MKKRFRILVLGLSVTAEKNGYVERAVSSDNFPADVDVKKIGIGGVHPTHLKFLFKRIFLQESPDAIVAEISTSSFRSWSTAIVDQEIVLQWLFFLCSQRDISVAILDLPRADVNVEDDWVFELNQRKCQTYGLPYKAVRFRDNLVRDLVHPTDEGKTTYASALLELIAPLTVGLGKPTNVSSPNFAFDALELVPEQGLVNQFSEFERAGHASRYLLMSPGDCYIQSLPVGHAITGLSFVMGPRSGIFSVRSAGEERRLTAYDPYCYYERVGMAIFEPIGGRQIEIEQLADIPDTPLFKGEKDYSSRLGKLGYLLTQSQLKDLDGMQLITKTNIK